ncbi:MAG: terminase small subunit [Nocardioides sp.]
MGDLRDAFDASVKAATHLTDLDQGTIEAARTLADKIDAWDVIVDWANEDAAENNARPAVPQNDNTSHGVFLRYCESLGLSPASRAKLAPQSGEAVTGGGSRVGNLQEQARKRRQRSA